MATVAKVARRAPELLTYPPDFPGPAAHAAAGCKGCAGLKGDCTAATKVRRLVVDFTLDDGRIGQIVLAETASDATVQAAIAAWATANPKPLDPLSGAVV